MGTVHGAVSSDLVLRGVCWTRRQMRDFPVIHFIVKDGYTPACHGWRSGDRGTDLSRTGHSPNIITCGHCRNTKAYKRFCGLPDERKEIRMTYSEYSARAISEEFSVYDKVNEGYHVYITDEAGLNVWMYSGPPNDPEDL